MRSPPLPTRRTFGAMLAATLVGLRGVAARSAEHREAPPQPDRDGWRLLDAAPTKARLRPEPAGETAVWAFDGKLPGPVIRLRHGEEARLRLVNHTPKPLSLHWHGVRNRNDMDGVGGLTQAPVAPGGSFDYRFTPPDPGTFLVRPLVIGGSGEPAERGLQAFLIVDEAAPPPVDADVALLVDDWRLDEGGGLAPFGDPLEAATSGRLGNLLTVGAAAAPHRLGLAPGARLRLRLANGCNARTMRIRFDGLAVRVAAIDGQPTDTFEPLRAVLPFPPGTRYDLMIDLPEEAGAKGAVTALLGPGLPLVEIATAGAAAGSGRPPLARLPENPRLPTEIRLQDAVRKEVAIGGGAGRGPDGKPAVTGDPARIWTIDGTSGAAGMPPLLGVKRGAPVVLALANRTPVAQPMHLHGYVFRLLHALDDGWEPYWLDTLQVPENRTVHIAFVADNPGKWALSSTVLERFDTGLWTWLEVS